MTTLSLDRLARLIGDTRARVHYAGESYIANVRCFMSSRDDHYQRDCTTALQQWVELMRTCVAEYDAQRQACNATDRGSTV